MPDGRVIVIGAGIGGLTSAALLAARGCDVTVVEAAETPGGKVRALDVGGRMVEAGPTVFTLREIFEEVFADCGASLDDHIVTRRADILARHAWGEQPLDLFADPQASEDAIGVFAGAAEARGYRAFSAEAKRLYDALDRPFLRRTKTDPLTLGWRMGVAGLRDYATLRPYRSMWRALGGYFGRSAAAAIVRALCHLLRIVPVPHPRDADADRARRSARRVADRRWTLGTRERARKPGET